MRTNISKNLLDNFNYKLLSLKGILLILFIFSILNFSIHASLAMDYKTQSDTAITLRITDLNRVITQSKNVQSITQTDLSTIITSTNIQIDQLNRLKLTIDSEIDQSKLNDEYNSIFNQFRIYDFFIPKQDLLLTLSLEDYISTDLSNLENIINAKIAKIPNTSASSASISVPLTTTVISNSSTPVISTTSTVTVQPYTSSLNILNEDLKSKLLEAHEKIKSATTITNTLTISSFNDSKTSLLFQINEVKQDIKIIRDDIKISIADLRNINKQIN